jgi:hypothetical protein
MPIFQTKINTQAITRESKKINFNAVQSGEEGQKMKNYVKEFLIDIIRTYKKNDEREIVAELMEIQRLCTTGGELDTIRAAVRAIDDYEGRKADREAERAFNEYEAEHGADGAAWSRRGGSAW